MIVFDITRRESFEHIKDWQKEIENNADQDIIVYLVGNMADLEEQRQVQKEEAEALVQELKFARYIETSAFTGLNIDEAFTTMTKHLFIKHENALDEYVS
jgi:small GTP-binding protein